jgi:hypothetical protein
MTPIVPQAVGQRWRVLSPVAAAHEGSRRATRRPCSIDAWQHQHMGSERLASLEAAYLAARDARDRLDVARARGEPADIGPLVANAARTEQAVRRELAGFEGTRGSRPSPAGARDALDDEDERALTAIRAGVATALGEQGGLPVTSTVSLAGCDDQQAWSAALAAGGPALRERTEACYGAVAQAIEAGAETLNRLQVLARLAAAPGEGRRRDLFLALRPLWRTVDGERSAGGRNASPYAALIRESAAAWRAGRSPIAANATALGVSEADIEAWVMAILDAWRAAIVEPDRAEGRTPMEPWDWWWRAASAGRTRADSVPRDAVLAINHRVYASLGADLDALGVVLDVIPRPSRPAIPVAFTTFGSRPHARPDGTWWCGRPTVLATYVDGGIDELAELVHETGHAVHLAAIRTRPAFTEWPASDALTEALADLVAYDVSDPAWQRRWIPGDAGPASADGPEPDAADGRDAVRSRHAQTVLDAAWSLLEIRQHAEPDRPANDIWTDITSTWLGVSPHPEWSWWAMRGQLIQEPGYMANYTIGAVLSADMRAALRAARGSWIDGDPGWYAWVSEHLYRFGLERSPAAVLRDLLGRAPTPDALLAEIAGTPPHA